MSKPIKRKCPQCGKVKLFRADCKTCGCVKPSVAPKVDPLVGKFWFARDENEVCLAGRIISRIGSSLYLVRYYDLYASGREGWHEKILSVSTMHDWEVSDEDYRALWLTVQDMEGEEQGRPASTESQWQDSTGSFSGLSKTYS
jgi:hypothetical protein